MIDTHAHLYLPQFKPDLPQVLERLEEAGVEQVFLPNIDHTSIDDMLELETAQAHLCQAMMGLHPCSVNKNFEKELYQVEAWLDRRPFAAIGEIGIDLHWDKSTFEYQKEAFTIQVGWAGDLGRPVVIHSRNSTEEILEILEALAVPDLTGVFHCFGDSKEQAERMLSLGFKLGIGGVLTFKNSGLDQTLEEIDLKHLVLETDSPYLAPAPHRGKRNEPSYISLVAQRLSEIKEKDLQEVTQVTTENARRLFSY